MDDEEKQEIIVKTKLTEDFSEDLLKDGLYQIAGIIARAIYERDKSNK